MRMLFENPKGSALLYGLVALFAASLTGLGLIGLSQSDKMSSIDFLNMRTSSLAARAGLSACEKQFLKQPRTALELLSKYIGDSTHQWLLVSDTNASAIESRMKINPSQGNSPQVSARITAFDPQKMLLRIEAFGYAGKGGRERLIGNYELRGLAMSFPRRRYAIYMGGDGRNFDSKVTINGNVYFAGDVHFNSSADSSVINGSFRTGSSSLMSSFDGRVFINGPAYFQTPLKSQNNSLHIGGKSGFEQDLQLDVNLQLNDSAFFNCDVSGNRYVDMNGFELIHSGRLNTSRVINAAGVEDNGGNIDIPSRLDLPTGSEQPFRVDLSSIPSSKIKSSTALNLINVTGAHVQGLYNAALASGELWNGFLVVRVDGFMNMQYSADVVDANVMWIVEKTINCNGNWYENGAGSNTMVYVDSGGVVNQFGSSGFFRGYVHVAGTGSCSYNWGVGNDMVGSIHHVDSASGFQHNSGSRLYLTYDDSVISEFIDMGIVTAPGGGGGSGSGQLVLVDTRIRPILLGIHY